MWLQSEAWFPFGPHDSNQRTNALSKKCENSEEMQTFSLQNTHTKSYHTFIMHVQGFEQILSDRVLCFKAQPLNIWRSIVAWERGEVDAGDSFQQPSRLQREQSKEWSSSVYTSKAKLP